MSPEKKKDGNMAAHNKLGKAGEDAVANYLVARKLDPANAAKYNYKMRMMSTEAGRKSVVSRRFLTK